MNQIGFDAPWQLGQIELSIEVFNVATHRSNATGVNNSIYEWNEWMTLDENEANGTYVRYNDGEFDLTKVRRRHGTCRLITLNGLTEIASVTISLHCFVQLFRNQLG